MTQFDLATCMGVAKSTVANWESGKHYPLRYIGKLEAVLGISLTETERDRRPPIPAGLRRYVAALEPDDREWVLEELRKVTGPSEDPAGDLGDDEREEL